MWGGGEYIRLWPPGWGTVQIGTGEAPPLCPSGNDLRGCWCSCSPRGRGSLPGRPPPSWSPQTPESGSPCLFGGKRELGRSDTERSPPPRWLAAKDGLSGKGFFFRGPGVVFSPVALRRSSRKDLLSGSSTQTTFWVMFSEVEPTRPTAKKM